ncbi:MAG: hypothetical protein H7X91_12380, partial [Burkholderiales bacterium]|nr:hypothetical protein [Burkholderiales bacterium]
WGGALKAADEAFEVEMTISEAGHYILEYATKSGQTKAVELTSPGQKIEYVPRGGGVRTHVVESVSRQPGRLTVIMGTTFERASGGYLDQQFISESLDFVLTDEGLRTRLVTRSRGYFGDKEQSVGGGEDETVAVGVLQKTH